MKKPVFDDSKDPDVFVAHDFINDIIYKFRNS